MPTYEYIKHLIEPSGEKVADPVKNIIPGYTLKSVIGTGAFAEVYLAVDNNSKEEVAVKVLVEKGGKRDTGGVKLLKEFKRETSLWSSLEHNNIVTFIDSEPSPLPFIVMEYMGGGNLASLLKCHRLSIEEARHLMLQILAAFSYTHLMGKVHRDIKPENILFTRTGTAKISDWGIGKEMGSKRTTQPGEILRTLLYSAPEQSDQGTYGRTDWRTDVFQLAIIFYEMLTGKNPIDAKHKTGIITNLLYAKLPPPSSLNAEVPQELDEVVMGALERRKEDRWASGAVMLDRLKRPKRGPVPQNVETYKRFLHIAYLDGSITDNEKRELAELREQYGITQDVHDKLVMGIKKELGFDKPKPSPEEEVKESFEELKEVYVKAKGLGIDVSAYRGRYNKIRTWIRLKRYEKVKDPLPILLAELQDVIRSFNEDQNKRLGSTRDSVDELVETCLEKGVDINPEEEVYIQAQGELDEGNTGKALALFKELEGSLQGKIDDFEKEEAEEEEEPTQIVRVRCHNCKRPITITSPERPITVTCPNCGSMGRLEA